MCPIYWQLFVPSMCRQMTVGKLSQTVEQVTENVQCCIQKLASSLPGGWNNVRSLHLKAQDTPSVPIYVSFGAAFLRYNVYYGYCVVHAIFP